MTPLPLLLPLLLLILCPSLSAAATYALPLHHRLSDRVRRLAGGPSSQPEPRTPAYYRWLVDRDRAAGADRRLSGADAALTFSEGNLTVRINKLGFLHYAEVSIGTPSVSFLVALDTGSDLFWVPCDCQSCASTSSQTYGVDFDLSLYSPNSSLTSKKVFCNNTLCETPSTCETSDLCPYKVTYISSGTSSSGLLVEDVLYLTSDDSRQEAIEARVTFGCGQMQTGSFLDSAAPNGLFGLGMEKLSVPSILASSGLVSDSFSLCFAHDGTGRISFGDHGSSDQEETPFIPNQPHPTYIISVTGMKVGNASFVEGFNSLIDSGTSFTTLSEPAYTHFTESFNSQVKDDRQTTDSQIPFEYCYLLRSNQTDFPVVSLITRGGSEFPIISPIIFVSLQTEVIYCLAIVKGSNWNIIGQNFMTGLRVVFDREKLVLAWKKFDCYTIEDSSVLPVKPPNSGMQSPPFGAGSSSLDPEAAKQTGNKQISAMQPSLSQPSCLRCHAQVCLLLLALLAIIL